MSNVAVIGLGIMGLPMAINLVKAGHTVTGFNRSQDKIDKLVSEGGKGATSIADAVKDADVVITMVPDSPDVEGVVGGEEGVFANAKQGTLWIDASSIRPDVAVRLAEAAKAAGIRPLDAPVSGGEQGAIDAVLSIMVGGSAEDFEAAQPVLNAVGKTIVHVGPSGSGQTVKAANQLIVAVNIEVLGEAIAFLEAYGVDTDAALKVLGGGLAGSRSWTRRARRCSTATSTPASASPCTTRTWASSPPQPARPTSPSRSARLSPSWSPPPSTRATAAWTTRDSSSRSCSSPAASKPTAARRETSKPGSRRRTKTTAAQPDTQNRPARDTKRGENPRLLGAHNGKDAHR